MTQLERQCDTSHVMPADVADAMFPPPWRPSGFVRVVNIVNLVTGEYVQVDAEIHADDLDWLTRTWQELFELDWRIHLAEQERSLA